MQGIAHNRVSYIPFYAAVFTNLSREHLDFHKTMQHYFNTKEKLFEQTSGDCIVNVSDRYGKKLYQMLKEQNKDVFSFGFDQSCDYALSGVKTAATGTSFTLKTPDWKRRFAVPLIGACNAVNCGLAAALAAREGFGPQELEPCMKKLRCVPGRLELIYSGTPKVYLDYAHTPEAIRNAIETLKGITTGRLITLFGCGGERDHLKRSEMGKIATSLSDHVVITNDNPRSEPPNRIISQIVKGCEKQNYTVVPDRALAVEHALSMAGENDFVLLAGKGHEEYQIFGEEEIPFSERECVKKYFLNRNQYNL